MHDRQVRQGEVGASYPPGRCARGDATVTRQLSLDELDASAAAQDMSCDVELRDRDRPEQVDRHPSDDRRRPGRSCPLDGTNEKRGWGTGVLQACVPRPTRVRRRGETIVVNGNVERIDIGWSRHGGAIYPAPPETMSG